MKRYEDKLKETFVKIIVKQLITNVSLGPLTPVFDFIATLVLKKAMKATSLEAYVLYIHYDAASLVKEYQEILMEIDATIKKRRGNITSEEIRDLDEKQRKAASELIKLKRR